MSGVTCLSLLIREPDFFPMDEAYFQVGRVSLHYLLEQASVLLITHLSKIFESEWPEHVGDLVSLSSTSSQQYFGKLYKFIVIQLRRDHVSTV